VDEMRNACHILIGKLNGKEHLEDLDVNTKVMLEWFLKR
jgi:hypothetical protein